MKRGRKKDPENVVAGSQARAVLGDVEPPDYLDEAAQAIFRRLATTLDAMNILTIGDLDIVASLAEVISLGRLHKAKLDDDGATQSTRTGREVYSGDYLIWRDMKETERKLLNDLGLTPASRTRVAAAVATEVDEFAAFMASRNETKGKGQGNPQAQD